MNTRQGSKIPPKAQIIIDAKSNLVEPLTKPVDTKPPDNVVASSPTGKYPEPLPAGNVHTKPKVITKQSQAEAIKWKLGYYTGGYKP